MRTDIFSFILGSKNRKAIVGILLQGPTRLWSCSAVEDLSALSHATVFRTLRGLRDFGLLRSSRVNRKDIVYELALESPLLAEVERALGATQSAARSLAKTFSEHIRSPGVKAVLLYGSAARGDLRPGSDIDVLVVLRVRNAELERAIKDTAAELASRANWTISVVVLDEREVKKKSPFLLSVKNNREVLYGKDPFGSGEALA